MKAKFVGTILRRARGGGRISLLALGLCFWFGNSARAAEPPLVRIAHGAFNEKVEALWTGVEQGFFRKHGVSVEVINIRSGPQTMAALASGDIHMAYTIPGSVLSAAAGGMDIAFFTGVVNRGDGDFVVAPAIRRGEDLKGKRVGVGSPGSGAFANCELFFRHLGVWDTIIPVYIGYNEVALAFANKQIDAFWLFTASPSSAITLAAKTGKIDLLNLDSEARASGFYKKYPYFTPRTLPAGTYRGVRHNTRSFQDSTLWVAGPEVTDEVVYSLLATIYDKKGLCYLGQQNPALKTMAPRSGAKGLVIPMHPGATRFWKEKGLF